MVCRHLKDLDAILTPTATVIVRRLFEPVYEDGKLIVPVEVAPRSLPMIEPSAERQVARRAHRPVVTSRRQVEALAACGVLETSPVSSAQIRRRSGGTTPRSLQRVKCPVRSFRAMPPSLPG